MGIIRSILVTSAAFVALLAISVPAAQADTRRQADAIMNMDYRTFIEHKRKHAAPPFNWSSDGCSGPTPPAQRRLFNGPCQQHDFGYRNYGNGLRLSSNEATRRWIDDRFLFEMRRLCNNNFSRWYQRANRRSCLNEARMMWAAVRHGGRHAFYHG